MSLTLLEAAKLALNNGEFKRAGVIAMFAEQSAVLAAMPFNNIPGNSYAYNQEAALPGVAFRGVNESYTESTGVINPQSESLRIAGGDLDVDKFLVDTNGLPVRAKHEALKAKALAAEITRVIFKGDSETQPREFDGLQKRITGAQLVSNGSTNGGDPLSLAKLDEAFEAVPGATVAFIPRVMRLRFTALLRNSTLMGNLMLSRDDIGKPVLTYNGVPLLAAYPDNDGTDPLGFNEVGAGGATATAASVYVARLGDGYLSMIQNGTMRVTDLGELQTAPKYRTRVEWYPGMVVEHGRAVARLYGISNAAIVA